jgi:hypothetical protein
MLLIDIRKVFDDTSSDILSSKALIDALASNDKSMWGTMPGTGKVVTGHYLARALKPFGIKPTIHRMGAAREQARGYRRSDFGDAWERCIPKLRPVCGTHDRSLGRRAFIKMGWSRQDAISWERDPEFVPYISNLEDARKITITSSRYSPFYDDGDPVEVIIERAADRIGGHRRPAARRLV